MSAILKLLSKFDDSGINKAKKSFGGLKTALGAVGIGFGLKAITDGLMDAAKAASADQKSIQLLNNQLRRNANATEAQVKANDKFIDGLAIQTGIVDDELRPAMGQLVRATGDVSKAQKLLGLALDASAATGRPLNTVTRALSNAFVGNRTQLTRLFPALKESKDLFGDLEKQVGGTAEAQASPFGKLNNALETLQEKLGSIILPYVEQFVTEFIKPGGVGDCGNVNNSSAVWTLQSAISYQAPASSFTISSTGTIIMPYSWNSSDERIKTNVKTIEYALDKVLLLRGVEYNDFRYEPDKKHIGLIAQEVELIIPEAVGVNEFDNIKCISYNSIIGVLVEAVKQLNNKVLNLENIIKNNNLS